jgi:hypothetical protein
MSTNSRLPWQTRLPQGVGVEEQHERRGLGKPAPWRNDASLRMPDEALRYGRAAGDVEPNAEKSALGQRGDRSGLERSA